MRGARRLGALFVCVASIVAALDSEALLNNKKILSRGFTLSLDGDGNPVYVKIGTGDPEVVTVDVTERLEEASRQAFGAAHTQTARVRQELDAVRAARKGDAVDGSQLVRGPIVLDDPKDDGDEKTIDSID